jgi:hypothetical protein
MHERFCYSDKVIMDQVPRRSQGTSNLESTAQFSAAHRVNAIKEILTTSREAHQEFQEGKKQ